jgi:hypothetical protein
MKRMFILFIAVLVAAFVMKDKLIGRWQSIPSAKGNVTGVVFKEDGTLEGYINRKPFVSGVYTFENDVISFTDNGCNGARAVYRIIFFSNDDSIRFEVMSDTCTDRKNGMTRLVLGRVK